MRIDKPKQSKVIFGYIGAALGAQHLFKFKRVPAFKGDTVGFQGLVCDHRIMKNRDSQKWKRARIIVDILDDGEHYT